VDQKQDSFVCGSKSEIVLSVDQNDLSVDQTYTISDKKRFVCGLNQYVCGSKGD
jgi:hypothetical protein